MRGLAFGSFLTIAALWMQAASFALLFPPEPIAAPIPDDEPYVRVWGARRVAVVVKYLDTKSRGKGELFGCVITQPGKENLPSVLVPLDLYDEIEPSLEKLKDGVSPLK